MSLVIDGLWWRYPTFSEKSSPWVLRGIDLEIEPGECFGITGPSGAGKTTLCRAMLGAIPYSSRLTPEQLPQHFRGTITAAGEPVTARTPATNRVGMVLQDPENQFLRMSLLHELGLGLQIQGLPTEEILQRAYASLCSVGLEQLWHGAAYLHPADLSGGEKQRVAIASFLAMRPQVLLLDEPTSDLDPPGKREVIETIARLRKETFLRRRELGGWRNISRDAQLPYQLRTIVRVRRAARSVTPNPAASSPAVAPGRFWRISRARSARAVGLRSVGTRAD